MVLFMQTDTTKYRLPIYVTDSFEDLASHAGVSVEEVKRQISRAKRKGRECHFLIVECEDIMSCSKCLHNQEGICSNDMSERFGETINLEDFCIDWERGDSGE